MTLLAIAIGAGTGTVNAQPSTPDANNPADPDLPLDGGVALLIAAGVGYGIKKVRDEQKKRKSTGV